MTVKEKVAYLRGLIAGAEFYGKDQQAKAIWESLLDVCDALADEVETLGEVQEEVQEHLEALDADLTDLEADVYGEEDDDDDEFVEMKCPNCGEKVSFEEEFLYDDDVEISCPNCGQTVFAGRNVTTADRTPTPATSVGNGASS